MIFNFTIINNRQHTRTDIVRCEIGKDVIGLMLSGTRPESITLTKNELCYLLQNKEYTVGTVLRALSDAKPKE